VGSILHIIEAGGVIMYPLLLLSIVAGAVIVERLLAYRQLGNTAPGLLKEVVGKVRAGRHAEALEACEERPGPVAACLAVVLRDRRKPVPEVERLVQETGQDYFLRLERYLPVLDTTTTVSPLLGLLGTIIGMIGTFNAVAGARDGNNDGVLAGVGEALYATATGLVIAVICFIAYNYFASRLRSITGETEQAATKLINVLSEEGTWASAPEPSLEARNHAGRVPGERERHEVQPSY
jgi:biopolymer transport protein ExbB